MLPCPLLTPQSEALGHALMEGRCKDITKQLEKLQHDGSRMLLIDQGQYCYWHVAQFATLYCPKQSLEHLYQDTQLARQTCSLDGILGTNWGGFVCNLTALAALRLDPEIFLTAFLTEQPTLELPYIKKQRGYPSSNCTGYEAIALTMKGKTKRAHTPEELEFFISWIKLALSDEKLHFTAPHWLVGATGLDTPPQEFLTHPQVIELYPQLKAALLEHYQTIVEVDEVQQWLATLAKGYVQLQMQAQAKTGKAR